MSLVRALWSVLSPPQRRRVLIAQAVSVLMAFSTTVGIASIAPFFAVLGNPALIADNPLLRRLYQLGFAGQRGFMLTLGLAFVALVVLANLINIGGSFVLARLALHIGTELQAGLFGEYLARPLPFHQRTSSAVLFNNVIHETSRATNSLLQNAFALVTNLVTAVFILLSVLALDPVIAVGMLAVLSGGYGLIYLAMRQRLIDAGEAQSECFTSMTRTATEAFSGIKQLLLLHAQASFHTRFAAASRAYGRAVAHTQLIAQTPRHLMECVAIAGLVGVALYNAYGAGSDRPGGLGGALGELTFLGFAAYRLLPTLQQAFISLVRIRADRAGFLCIVPDLRLARPAAGMQAAAAAVDNSWQGRPHHGIDLRGVCYRYDATRATAIDGVSLHIAARQVTGLIGASGSGKTTLMDLLAGLLLPLAGSIEIDGVPLDENNRASWQAQLAYVPQETFLLDGSIAQNIAFGAATGLDHERVRAAAQAAQIADFVASLPRGYEQSVGERGVNLSGGERQRIGIARALYARASVLLLDEPTSALDSLNEQELLQTLYALRGQCTVVLIAHRPSTIRACDWIYELQQGRIIAGGDYTSLRPEARERVPESA